MRLLEDIRCRRRRATQRVEESTHPPADITPCDVAVDGSGPIFAARFSNVSGVTPFNYDIRGALVVAHAGPAFTSGGGGGGGGGAAITVNENLTAIATLAATKAGGSCRSRRAPPERMLLQ